MKGYKGCFKKQVLLCAIVSFISFVVNTKEVSQLYEVEVPVASRMVNQPQLMQQGLREVLVRVSGTEKVLSLESVNKALSETDKYISKFSYHQRSAQERTLKMIFNETLINQLLNSIGQKVWGKNRPLVLVWLAVEKGGATHWVGADADAGLTKELEKAFDKRKIPVVLPMFDLAETQYLTENETSDEADGTLQRMSTRYKPEVVLKGKLIAVNDEWQSHWTLLRNGEKNSWDSSAAPLDKILNTAVEELSLRIIDQPIIVSDAGEKVLKNLSISVSGILNAEQYNKVIAHLHSLPEVFAVEAEILMPEKTVFNVQTISSQEAIVKAIHAGKILVEAPSLSQAPHTLYYKVAGE